VGMRTTDSPWHSSPGPANQARSITGRGADACRRAALGGVG
jgi:hypothetical protein